MSDVKKIKWYRIITLIKEKLTLLEEERDGDWYSLNSVFVIRINTYDDIIRIYINDIYEQFSTIERTGDIDNEIIKIIKQQYKSKYYNLDKYETTLITGIND